MKFATNTRKEKNRIIVCVRQVRERGREGGREGGRGRKGMKDRGAEMDD